MTFDDHAVDGTDFVRVHDQFIADAYVCQLSFGAADLAHLPVTADIF